MRVTEKGRKRKGRSIQDLGKERTRDENKNKN